MGLVLPVGALSAVIQAWTIFMHKRALHRVERHVIRYAPMLMREQKRITNLNCIFNCNDREALWMLRMKRAPFARLVQTFRTSRLLEDSIHTGVEEQVAMFLHIAGHNQKFRVIHNTFKWSVETISRYFKQVLYAVGELRGEMDCIREIDGTHVTARVPRKQSAAYRGGSTTQARNVLAAVDFDQKFTYVLAGWEGSAYYANILSDNISRLDGVNIPDGKFYLGEADYACRLGVLPPFRKTSLRVTVERAFGALKNRFNILDQKSFHPYPTQVKLVLACCILHNWIPQLGIDELVPEEEEVTPDDLELGGYGVEAFDNEALKNKRLE
ncbi:uncharacterized protein [Aegilops tauschii subsp. strangulata]|uniref:uncharacterized protein n=1 Tax=Aegilops tauschii subsp. strangulata TaxID=200361 RepID=UPI003CC8BD9E